MKNLTRTTLISLATVTALTLGAWATCADDVDMGEHNIINVADPVNDQDVATKKYVDDLLIDVNDLLIDLGAKHLYTRDDAKETVKDMVTKLMWQDNEEAKTIQKQWLTDAKYDNCLEAIEREEELGRCDDTTGDTAATYCSNLELGGYNDWRLPTKTELSGIVKEDAGSPTISDVFNNTSASFYWSSSSLVGYENKALFVNFNHGNVNGNPKDFSEYVRCVRDGQ